MLRRDMSTSVIECTELLGWIIKTIQVQLNFSLLGCLLAKVSIFQQVRVKILLVCRTRLLRACEIRSQCVSFAQSRSLELSLSYSIVFHTLSRVSLVLPVFFSTINGHFDETLALLHLYLYSTNYDYR